MLKKGEIIEVGDEMKGKCKQWVPVHSAALGGGLFEVNVGRFRRPVAQETVVGPDGGSIGWPNDNGSFVTGPDSAANGGVTEAPTSTRPQLSFTSRDEAVDALVRRVFGAEPVYADQSVANKPVAVSTLESHACGVPLGLPPLPPVPEGYDRWEYRGLGWESDGEVVYGCAEPGDKDWGESDVDWDKPHESAGISDFHYIEAIKDTPPPPNNATRDDILFHLDRIINQGADSDVRLGYHPDALWLEEARQMIFTLEHDRRQLHSALTQASYRISHIPLRNNIDTLLKAIEPS